MNRNTKVHYNPDTNELRTGVSDHFTSSGFLSLGSKTVAAAFTKISPEERRSLWLAVNSDSYGIDLTKLNSKIRHKLKKLGLYQLSLRRMSKGQELLIEFKQSGAKKRTW